MRLKRSIFAVTPARHGRQSEAARHIVGQMDVVIDGDFADELTIGHIRDKFGWELGALVETVKDGPRTSYAVVPHTDGDRLPDSACIGPRPPKLRLVSEVAEGGR